MNTRAQQRAARVLVALLGEDLPQATWTISPYGGSPNLDGQIDTLSTPADIKLSGLQMWADRLAAEIDVRRYEKHTGGNVSATGYIDGVRVYVWAAFLEKDPLKTGGPDA